MDDAISRKAAIDELDKGAWGVEWDKTLAKTMIESLPSAQPERKRGKWIDYTDEGYVECPFCHSATNCDGNEDELHFCFSCGADMREDDHEAR